MSSRIFQHIRQIQRINRSALRLNCQIFTRHYAILEGATDANRDQLRLQLNAVFLNRRNLSTRAEIASSDKEISKHSPTVKDRLLSVDQLLSRLERLHQQNGYVSSEVIESLINLLEAQPEVYNQLLQPEKIEFLLSACGLFMPAKTVTKRYETYRRLWKYLSRHNQLTSEHYRTHMLVLQHNRLPLEDVEAFLKEYAQLGGDINSSEIFAEILAVACSSGNKTQVSQIVGEMRAKNLAITVREFNALILGHARNGDLNGCQTLLESITASGLTPNNDTWTNLIIAYLENGEQTKAADLLRKYSGQLNVTQILDILQSVLYADVSDEVLESIIKELPLGFTNGTEVPIPLRSLCVELLHKGKLETVCKIISFLPSPVFNDQQSTDTYGAFLLHELFRAQVDTSRIIDVARLLKASGKNSRSLYVVTEIAMRLSPPAALPFLEALALEDPLRPHYFWPLMMYNFRRHGEGGVLRTLKFMSQFDVACDKDTLTQYVLPRLAITLDDPVQALKQFDEAGLKMSQVLTPVLVHMLSQQKLEHVAQITELYTTRLDVRELIGALTHLAVNVRATKRYQAFAKAIQALAKRSNDSSFDFVGKLLLDVLHSNARLRDDVEAIYRFVYEMQKIGLSISPAALDRIQASLPQADGDVNVEKIVKCLKKMSKSSLSLSGKGSDASAPSPTFIKHPREMTIDELECHLVELESKAVNARGVLRRLLQLCVRDGRLERAQEIKAKCDKLNVQISPGMLASIFDLYIKLKDLPNAQESLQRLKRIYPGFQIDEHKVIDYAALLVHEGQLDAGKQLLKERSASQKIIGGDYVLKNVWNFLTNTAHLAAKSPDLPADRNLTRETFAFLTQLGYCNAHNALLGPIVREYLLRGNITAAVNEFCRLAKQYKHTPLQFELLSLLVRLCNGEGEDVQRFGNITPDEAQVLLKDVTDAVVKCHGPTNMNSALLLAIAESGTDKQLRRMLINPEIRINQELLLKNCEHLGQEGSVQTLLRLARGARGLNNVLDETSIYNMLLGNFSASNNWEAALKLFQCLESDGELKISQEFLRNLVKLLKANNVDVPSNIALRAQVI